MSVRYQIQLKGNYFTAELPNKRYKRIRILLEYLPVQRIAFKPIKKNHVFLSDSSIGFNFDLINEYGAPYFDIIYINYYRRWLWTSRQAILKYGKCRMFNKSGLDTQIFLQLKCFKNTKAEAAAEIEEIHRMILNERTRENIHPEQAGLF